ncbi:hypothetical protein GCM10008179_28980 [Hansschlegelia plantiphila]|uniref:Uncharacterized protein n=1 Tax=Hansschlegelia plantiphila TaxID=374655 RepID=A0A9W6J4V9_9HYPH|nr:hypothetical protein GCM10008179_28980 [Hansschlegelia plantiphila]
MADRPTWCGTPASWASCTTSSRTRPGRSNSFAPRVSARPVIAGVDAVTRRPGESYGDFIVREPTGREVKIAGIADNMDLFRLTEVTAKDRRRLVKYQGAMALLT